MKTMTYGRSNLVKKGALVQHQKYVQTSENDLK